MSNFKIKQNQSLTRIWLFLIVIIIFLGIFFRFANLDKKIYWVDEVATSIRIAGYTKQEVIQQLSEQDVIETKDLQKYQQLNPEKDFSDTLNALIKSPEHAPLYFLILRVWVQLFGNSVAAIRSLSVIFSLLALPCIYWLCLELFKSPLVGGVAIALLSISPFYVTYAQEARPYSLWTVTILLSSVAILRALRLNNCRSWSFYIITLILGFYTSLLSFWSTIAQGIYVLGIKRVCYPKVVKHYLIAFSLATIAFIPWILAILYNFQRLQDNTTWMRVPMEILSMVAIWIYSILIIFVELPIYKELNPLMLTRIIIDLNLLALVVFSFYYVFKQAPKRIWLFIATLTIIPALILILIDLIVKGQSSTAPRYLIPYQLGIILTVSYTLNQKVFYNYLSSTRKWKIVLITLISIGIFSSIFTLEKSPKYQKTRNLHNIPIAAIVNATQAPILVVEPQETLDILSLSYILEPQVKVQFLGKTNLSQLLDGCHNIFLFNPSSVWQKIIKQESNLKLEQVYTPNLLIPGEISLSLWMVKSLENTCSKQN